MRQKFKTRRKSQRILLLAKPQMLPQQIVVSSVRKYPIVKPRQYLNLIQITLIIKKKKPTFKRKPNNLLVIS
jgi:hypothetical protein